MNTPTKNGDVSNAMDCSVFLFCNSFGLVPIIDVYYAYRIESLLVLCYTVTPFFFYALWYKNRYCAFKRHSNGFDFIFLGLRRRDF